MTPTPQEASIALAERLNAAAIVCRVVSAKALSTSIHEVVLAGQAARVAGAPGNDVMVQLTSPTGRLAHRRYSVRDVNPDLNRFTLWITTAHDGPGSDWVKGASPGDEIDVIGPRGKIVLDQQADWHLFVGDITELASAYRLGQSIEAPGRAVFIFEIDHADDALTATFDDGIDVTGIFVDRMGRSKDNPSGLLGGLAAFAFPLDQGHAYVFGEFHVMKAVRTALVDRGLEENAISAKAFWRFGRNNADHGEPDKSED